MSSVTGVWVIAIAFIVILFIVILIAVISELAYERDEMQTQARISGNRQPPQTPIIWTHSAPARPFTTGQAHSVMQIHKDCTANDCPRKRAARQTLIEAGVLVPRSRHAPVRRSTERQRQWIPQVRSESHMPSA